MPTRAALCPEILKEQIQKHTAMGNETTLSGAAGCGNNDADTLAVTNGSVSASTGNPGPSELVSSVFEVTDSLETQVNMEDLASIDVQADKLNPKAPSKTHVSMINNSELSEAGSPRSLRQLQEMALTAFSRRNWAPESYKTIEVELRRDPILGLGITVAGYVHKKGLLLFSSLSFLLAYSLTDNF
uniref:Uncharacterized protein n=1 Tax=Setaria digitata TaxID=48799 RepID=A0A915PD31_9BILA